MDFFKMAVGIDGGKFNAHRVSFLKKFRCKLNAIEETRQVSNVLG
jgi:hypothetical protein